MREIFMQELAQVGDDLQRMSRLVIDAIENASTALQTADLQLAESVIRADEEIDEIERSLDEQCISLIARQAPVATDLRVVIAALRMSSTIERMGDLARHIAYVARGRYPEVAPAPAMRGIFDEMGTAATKVAHQVNKLLATRDLELAAGVERDDDTLDALHKQTFTILLDPEVEMTKQQMVDGVLLGRYFERFGDHGVSVARRTSYLVTGDLTNSVARDTDPRD
ncbi:phosphate signaling complex protein PhoU [Georgenia sp. H159]|uniref:phosphate signaling complex protein PhoU n=1 Tax=Georgenia sp. H159 TaxID=3076115 RepID=UPI002D7A3E88|nr:phosphate signaling complex protein PhoU [Georgenia sp. H159]